MIEINLNLIKIEARFRQDMGDIQALANSISELGQLQPIGLDANYNLIFGERRVMACKLLSQEKIKAEIIHLNDILKGEYAENEVRKDFTISECVAIGKAIEVELGDRQGKRTDRNLPSTLMEVPGKETAQIAAEKSGLGSKNTFKKAKKVTENGAPELVEKMDKKEVSISTAAKIADMKKDEQKEIISQIDQGIKPSTAIKTGSSSYNINVSMQEPENLYELVENHIIETQRASLAGVSRKFNVSVTRASELLKQMCANELLEENINGGFDVLQPETPKKTELKNEPDNDEPEPAQKNTLRIDHLVSLIRQVHGFEPRTDNIFDMDLSSEYKATYRTTFFDDLEKKWITGNTVCFYKIKFGLNEQQTDEEITRINENFYDNFSVKASAQLIITELKPHTKWFKFLTEIADHLCLPHDKLSLMHAKDAIKLGNNKFHTTDVAIFYIDGCTETPEQFDILFGRIGSVWN